MTDVSTWSPLDGDNNLPPPDGWPEFMQPSGVNNCGRMMMGAVRRMYDSQVSGSLVLPYLKLSGGTVTGATTFSAGLTAASITSNGTIYASSTISTGGNVTASGNVTGNFVSSAGSINAGAYQLNGVNFATRSGGNDTHLYDTAGQPAGLLRNPGEIWHFATVHRLVSRDGAVAFADINSARMNLSVPLTAGTITASNITTGGILANATGAAFYAPNGGIQVAGGATIGGTVSAGGVSTGGTVSGGYIASSGNINAANAFTGGAFAGSSVNVGGEVRGGALATGGQLATGGNADIGGNCYVASVLPHSDFTGICGGASQGWHDVVSYNYVTLSDAALKTDLGPLPDTLALVSAIEPQAFRYGNDPIRHWGFVAQDVRSAIGDHPVDVVWGEEGHLGVDYGAMTAMLWQAVRVLAAKVRQLEETNV